MPQLYAVDQAATFHWLMFLSSAPKTAFGDNARQETTKEGLPKWEVQFAACFAQFGRPTNEIIKVGIAAERDPGEALDPSTMVQLVGFEIGVMDKKNREGQVIGAQVWYRCQEVRPLAATGGRGAKNTEAAS